MVLRRPALFPQESATARAGTSADTALQGFDARKVQIISMTSALVLTGGTFFEFDGRHRVLVDGQTETIAMKLSNAWRP